jgi:hypothetical protein
MNLASAPISQGPNPSGQKAVAPRGACDFELVISLSSNTVYSPTVRNAPACKRISWSSPKRSRRAFQNGGYVASFISASLEGGGIPGYQRQNVSEGLHPKPAWAPAIAGGDLKFGDNLVVNFGVGFGVTNAGNRLVYKMRIGYLF